MPGCHVQPEQMFNLIFGYNDRVTEWYGANTDAGGALSKAFTPVAAGEVLVVQAIWGRNNGATGSAIELLVYDGALPHYAKVETGVAQYIPAVFTGQLVLKAGDYVQIIISGGGAAKPCQVGYWGYKMVLTQ